MTDKTTNVTDIHSFSKTIARKCGILAAVIYQHIAFWVEKNAANERHAHEGRYWTYSSIAAFGKIFDYASPKQIRNAIDKLIDAGLVITGDFNQNRYDRTKWYTTTDDSSIAPLGMESEENNHSEIDESDEEKDKKVISSFLNGQFNLPIRKNQFAHEGEPIPDIKPDIKTDINPLVSNSNEFETQAENSSAEKTGPESQTGKKSKKAEPKKPADKWTHFGKNREMAIKFSESSGIKPVGKEYGKWNKALNALAEAGILAEHIPRIVAEMRRSELTIGGPESLLKIGRDMLARGKLKTISHTAEPQEKVEYETWLDENGCWRSRRKVKSTDERSGISAA